MSARTFSGPVIVERRPRRPRTCLNCDRTMVTTVDTRLCPTCTTRAASVRGGVDEAVGVSLKERGWRRVVPPAP
jgi:hypothetical protein